MATIDARLRTLEAKRQQLAPLAGLLRHFERNATRPHNLSGLRIVCRGPKP